MYCMYTPAFQSTTCYVIVDTVHAQFGTVHDELYKGTVQIGCGWPYNNHQIGT